SRETYATLVPFGRDGAGGGIVENEAELALVLAGELTDFEIPSPCRGFPVDMAGIVFGSVVPNAIEVVTAAANVRFKLAGNERKHFEKLVRRFNRWVDDDFALHRDGASLREKREGEARLQAEAVLHVAAAARKPKFHGSLRSLFRGNERKIHCAAKDLGGRKRVGGPSDGEVGPHKPFVAGFRFGRKAERRTVNRNVLPGTLVLGWNHTDRKCGDQSIAVAEHQPRQRNGPGEEMFRDNNIEL